MACINPNDPEFKKILKQVGGNPLLAAIEFNKLYPEEGTVESEVIKPGVPELFESNSELANAVYEALGFGLEKKLKSSSYTKSAYDKLKNDIEVFNKEKTLDNLINIPFYIKNAPKSIKKKLGVFYSAEESFFGEETDESGYKGFVIAYEDGQFNLYTSKNYEMLGDWGIGTEDQEKLDISLEEIKELIKYAEPSRNTEERWKSINEAIKITPQQKQQALQLYSQYLDTIFPDSKEKDILKHTTKAAVEKFKKGSGRLGEGIYLAAPDYKMYDKAGPNVYRAIVNVSNIKKYDAGQFNILANEQFPTQDEYSKEPQRKLQEQDKAQGINAYVSTATTGTEYNIFEPEQIHILGTKQDIEGFKEFVDKSTFKQLELDPEMSNYIADQISKAFNVPIPGMEKDTLITAEEIENFNRDVENRDGRLPSEYFTGIDDVNKWVLNKSELYDLVDKDTGEIYLKDVNLSTGQVEKQDVPSQPVPDKERQEAIDYLNNAVKDFRIDEILAERGYDVNDIISNLASAENKEEFDKIINKLLRLLC